MINSISTDFKRDQTSVKINDQLLEQTYGARN
jgi:hypothetical protein